MGVHSFFENGDANGPARPGLGPDPGPGLASPEAMSMHIDDISTIASPFSKKVKPHLQNPFEDSAYCEHYTKSEKINKI